MNNEFMEKLSGIMEALSDSMLEDESVPTSMKVMTLITTASGYSNKIMKYINEDPNDLEEHSIFLGFILEDLKKFITDAKELKQRVETNKIKL